MADLVTIATTAVLSQFLGPTAKHLGEQALERAKQVARQAATLLGAVGREPQFVEPKLLLPLVQAASLETDATLTEKWAALLANAADPAQRVSVQLGFAEVLRQLTPTDARVLEIIATREVSPKSSPPGYLAIVLLNKHVLPLTEPELHVITGNLTRLGLCLSVSKYAVSSSEMMARDPRHNAVGPGIDYIRVTPFGHAFLAACISPSP